MMGKIFEIRPRCKNGIWYFADESLNIYDEIFVGATNGIINYFVRQVPMSQEGFVMRFSEDLFDGFDFKVNWIKEENGGNWYYCTESRMLGWLCPVLMQYFDKAPKEIYIEVSPLS